MSDSKNWHLYEYHEAGCYVAETLEEARALLVKDCGDEDASRDMGPVPDDNPVEVADADGPYELAPGPNGTKRIRYLNRETKTAKEWAEAATRKGYRFGGDV